MLENIVVAVTQRTNDLDMLELAGLFAAEPWAWIDNCNIFSLILGCGTGYDHIDLLQRWLSQIRGFQFSEAGLSFYASHSARGSSSINTLDR
jgi:hypothetical protein